MGQLTFSCVPRTKKYFRSNKKKTKVFPFFIYYWRLKPVYFITLLVVCYCFVYPHTFYPTTCSVWLIAKNILISNSSQGCKNPIWKRTKPTLSATDVLAPTTMKNAAKCDTSCELQNPVSHQNFERNLHFYLRRSMSVGVSVHPNQENNPLLE